MDRNEKAYNSRIPTPGRLSLNKNSMLFLSHIIPYIYSIFSTFLSALLPTLWCERCYRNDIQYPENLRFTQQYLHAQETQSFYGTTPYS